MPIFLALRRFLGHVGDLTSSAPSVLDGRNGENINIFVKAQPGLSAPSARHAENGRSATTAVAVPSALKKTCDLEGSGMG